MTANKRSETEQPFIAHLLELRDRLLRMILAVLAVFLVLFPFANDIYHFVAEPLLAVMPEGTSMIATQVASPFLTPFKLSLVASVFLAMPVILYQFWAFVAPGLYQHEKRLVTPLLVSSIALFYLGMAFAYFVVFPLVFAFLTAVAPEGVAVMTDISHYLDFVLTLFFAFGVAFEVPIATIVLVWIGVTTPQQLAKKRPYIIVGAFVIGMFLTPPDIISQTLLALPMWVLFELGVQFSRFFIRERENDAEPGPAEFAADGPGEARYDRDPAAVAAAMADEEEAEEDEFVPLDEDEMETELDRIEAAEGDEAGEEDVAPAAEADDRHAAVEAKLVEANRRREALDLPGARSLLYEVLVEGDEAQVRTARNILQQLDDD